MSTAVAERPFVEQPEDTSFKPPLVHEGKIVVWYPDADAGAGAQPCIVTRVAGRSVFLRFLSSNDWGGPLGSVRHISDPELRERKGLRKNSGAWDFTGDDKERLRKDKMQQELIAALKRRVDELEASLTEPPKGKKS